MTSPTTTARTDSVSITAGAPAPARKPKRLLTREACELMGCSQHLLAEWAGQHGVQRDSRGTWPAESVTAWSQDPDLRKWLRRSKRIGPAKAADMLGLADRDWRWLMERELLPVAEWARNPYSAQAGLMAVFRIGDLEDLRAHEPGQLVPGTNTTWAAVRAVPAGQRSALRADTSVSAEPARPRRTTRTVGWHLRRWEHAHADDWPGLQLAWSASDQIWTADLPPAATGADIARLRAALGEVEELTTPLRRYRLRVGSDRRTAARQARAWAEPGTAVILDLETTDLDGYALEVAVIDAATGQVLLESLINPGCPIADEARAVHGISPEMLHDAPPLADLVPDLIRITTDRTVLTWGRDFDHSTIARHARRDGLKLAPVLRRPWDCLMSLTAEWSESPDELIALDGGHRALADVRAAREYLLLIAADLA